MHSLHHTGIKKYILFIIQVLSKTICAELAAALGIDPTRLEIERFGKGSILVDFCILPPLEDGAGSALAVAPPGGKTQMKLPLDAQGLAALLTVQLADPTSKLRKCPVISSVTHLDWTPAPLILAREAKRAIRRLTADIDIKSKVLRALKQEKDEHEAVLHAAAAAAIHIQRVYRGMKGRHLAKRQRTWQTNALTLQRVYRGHTTRARVAKLRAALSVTDEKQRAAQLLDISQLDQMRSDALAELKQAKVRYNQRRNDKYSAAVAASATLSSAHTAVKPTKPSGPPWWDAYSKERLRDSNEVLASDLSPSLDARKRDALTSKEIETHARPLICTPYYDFREERALLRTHTYKALYPVCADRGVAFSPIDPFFQLERPQYGRAERGWQWIETEPQHENPAAFKDELAWSKDMLVSFLVEIPYANAWLFWIGATYGWVPKGPHATAAKKACSWVHDFYEDTGFDTASITEMVYNRYVLEKIDQVSSLLKNKTFFYIRDETYADALSPEVAFRFVEDDESIVEQLQRFKESIRLLPSSLVTCDYRSPMTAVRQAQIDLEAYVKMSFLPLGDGYEMRRFRLSHSAFALQRRQPWEAKVETYEVLDDFLNPRNNYLTPLVLCAAAGMGKTALISNYVHESRLKLPHALFHLYFAGSSPGSCDYQRLCIGIQQALKDRFRLDIAVKKDLSATQMSRHLSQWFAAAGARGLVVLVIDGLDQLDDYDAASPLLWLPLKYTTRVRIILTTRGGAAYDECLRRSSLHDWLLHNLPPLPPASLVRIGIDHCKLRSAWTDTKPLNLGPQAVEKIAAHPPAGCPLHLRYLVDELCRQHQLDRLNNQDLFAGSTFEWQMLFRAQTIEELLDYVLHRWESIFHNLRWPLLVRRVCSLISASEWGLCEYELLIIMPDVPRLTLRQFLESTWMTWISHSGYYIVAHDAMRAAITKRYMPAPHDCREVHARLAGFFRWSERSRRKVEAELYHWRLAEQWVNVLGMCANMEVFDVLMEQGDQGSLHADLRRCVREADRHLDAYQALIDGLSRFESACSSSSDPASSHSRVTSAAIQLADFFGEMGRAQQAAQMYEAILTQEPAVLNASVASRHLVASVRVQYGALLAQRWSSAAAGTSDKSFGLVHRAQQLYQAALTALRDLVVEDGLEVESFLKEASLAVPEQKIALKQAQQALGKAHFLLADCLCKIARLSYRSGDFESAQHHYSEAAEYIEKNIGASHPLAAEAFLGLGILLYQRSKYDAAEKATRKAMTIRQIALGSGHPSFAEAAEALANICQATGRQFEYEQLTKRAVAILAIYGEQEQALAAPNTRAIQPDSLNSAPFMSSLKVSTPYV